MSHFRCYRYTRNGITLNMFQIRESEKSYGDYYYSVFFTISPTSKNRIAKNAIAFFDKKFDQIDITFVKDADVCEGNLFDWTNFGDSQSDQDIHAKGMLYDSVLTLENSLLDHDWDWQDMWETDTIESLRKLVEEEKQLPRSSTMNGSYCRSCNEFNSYASPDGVASDEKYTCWNCANSYMRVRSGLSADLNVRSRQIQAIQTYNKIRN